MDLLRNAYEKDMNFIQMKEISDFDEMEAKLLVKHAQINYEMLIEIYHYLQSRSKLYPWVDGPTIREDFIKELDILDAKTFNMAKFDVLLAQAKFSTRLEGKLDKRV